jgi:very-short-patch-repair endonuclease
MLALAQDTPLCPAGHLPHTGGDRKAAPSLILLGLCLSGKRSIAETVVKSWSISPRVGEMSGRTEGGNHTRNATLELKNHKSHSAIQFHRFWTKPVAHTPIPPQRRENAKRMRKAMTEAELKLWNAIRAHRLMGLSFRRQLPIAGYIVDFACPLHRLIVEVDGSQHGNETDQAYDQARTARLEADGWTVLRFWNDDILKDIDNICLHILTTSGRAMA